MGKKKRFEVIEGGAKGPRDPYEAPAHVTGPALDLWNELAPRLRALGWLTPLDVPAFTLMCISWGTAQEAAAELADAVTALGNRKQVKKHPAATILNEMLTQFRQFAAEFGITPLTRQRLRLPPSPKSETELERLIKGEDDE